MPVAPKQIAQDGATTNQVLTWNGTVWVPQTASGAGAILQTRAVEVTADQSTTSATFVDLPTLTDTITIVAGSVLIIDVSISFSNSGNNNNAQIRVDVDGTPIRAAGEELKGSDTASTAAIALRVTGLAAGARTVKVEWRTSGSTVQCRPATVPEAEHGTLRLMEATG